MCVILGAANAYLGLKSGMTIAATYPAAVIGMAVLRIWKGSILEENIARTAGSIGESVAAGAIFTLPAFLISGAWSSFDPGQAYWKSTAMMMVGSILGVLFVSLVRRVMVEDPSLAVPRIAGRRRDSQGRPARRRSRALSVLEYRRGRVVQLLGDLQSLRGRQRHSRSHRRAGHELRAPGTAGSTNVVPDRRRSRCSPVPPSAPPTWVSAT